MTGYSTSRGVLIPRASLSCLIDAGNGSRRGQVLASVSKQTGRRVSVVAIIDIFSRKLRVFDIATPAPVAK